MLLRLFLFFVTIDSITKTNRYCQGSAKSFQEKKRRMRENRQGKYWVEDFCKNGRTINNK